MLEVPKMKWSPKRRSVAQAGLSVAETIASRCCALSAASTLFTVKSWSALIAWLYDIPPKAVCGSSGPDAIELQRSKRSWLKYVIGRVVCWGWDEVGAD